MKTANNDSFLWSVHEINKRSCELQVLELVEEWRTEKGSRELDYWAQDQSVKTNVMKVRIEKANVSPIKCVIKLKRLCFILSANVV